MKITAYKLHENPLELIPGRKQRQWMDDTIHKYAYRCLPLQIANTTGWELLAPSDFLISWNGSNHKNGLHVHFENKSDKFAVSTFGWGIVTIHPGYLFKSSENVDMLVTGAPNFYVDYMSPLTGIVETFWCPFTFTMNWKLYKPGTFQFKKGDPLCFILPIQHDYSSLDVDMMDINDDTEVKQKFDEWASERRIVNTKLDYIQQTNQGFSDMKPEQISTHWEKNYYSGIDKSGNKEYNHIVKRTFPTFEVKNDQE